MTEAHTMSLRGGFGVFHDIIQPRVYASAYYINPPYTLAREQSPGAPFRLRAAGCELPANDKAFGLQLQ